MHGWAPFPREFPVTDPAAVRAALARILASERFQNCEALARLLGLAVERSLAGRRFKVKAAQAVQLRARLSAYYAGEGMRDPVRIGLPEDGSPAVFSTAAPPGPPPARRPWVWLAAALVAAVPVSWAGAKWHARVVSAQIRSLVVLPFADLTPQDNGQWLAASFTGETIDALDRVTGLRVVGRTSAFKAKGDAGRELDVAAVLQGAVRQTGERLRISLEMVRTSDGYHLWSASFDRPAQDLRSAQQAISSAVAARLNVRLPAARTGRHQPPAPAYDAYLQGRYFFDQGTPDALNNAAGRLEEATRIDPDFARAWAWLSIVREYRVAAGLARPNQAMPYSRDAAERAVALAPDLGDAHLALGIVNLQYDWDWAAAKAELDHALAASPGSAFALAWHARWSETQGRLNEAIAETARALAIDPLSGAILGDAAAQYAALNQPGRALPFAQKAVDLYPDDPVARAALANILLLAGQKEDARQMAEELRNSDAAAKLPPSMPASLAAQMGEPEDARQLLDEAEDLPDEELLPAIDYAELAGAIQDWDRLFSWTEEAYGERDVELPYWRLSPLMPHSDPRFDAFLGEMNLPAPSAVSRN